MNFEPLIYSFKEALENLFSSRLRSVLAIIGILVGTASVVALVSCGTFATQKAIEQFKSLGTDLLSVSISPARSSAEQKIPLDLDTGLNVASASKDIMAVAPYITFYEPLSMGGTTLQGGSVGATESLQNVIKIKMKTGRFISILDKYSYYCVIGHQIAEMLEVKGVHNPIGQQLQVGNSLFTIVGVADEWSPNSFFNGDINDSVIVPFETATLINQNASLNNILMQLKPGTNIDDVQHKITAYLQMHGGDLQLFFRSAKELITRMESQQHIFTLLLGMIGGISLLVGGIGVMNIMLVSVVERRREIGIRIAIGATRNDIRTLFLFEAAALACFGGFLGVLLGIFTSYVIAYFAQWDFSILFGPPTVGFLVSVAIGIFFGYYPASQAAKLDPIKTLRAE
jgi:putative ABC transport system permease protein